MNNDFIPMNNNLENQIMCTEADKLAYDAEIKKFLSNKSVLASLMQEYCMEYKGLSVENIMQYIENNPRRNVLIDEKDMPQIRGERNEDTVPGEGKVVFDILYTASVPDSERKIDLVINVEAQRENPKYPVPMRAGFYGCRMISRQMNTIVAPGQYGELRKCYTIWLILDPRSKWAGNVNHYSVKEEVLVGDHHENSKNYQLFDIFVVGLSVKNEENDTSFRALLSFLLFSEVSPQEKIEILETKFNMYSTESLKKEINMSNVGAFLVDYFIAEATQKGIGIGREEGIGIGREEGIGIGREEGIGIGREEGIGIGREEGIGIGREEGIGIGREEGIGIGREEGIEEKQLEDIRTLMETAQVPLITAMDFLRVPEEKRQHIREVLS